MARYRFWIRSSRGTDYEQVVALPDWVKDEEDVKEWLERWCAQFGAWHVGENAVSYGFQKTRRQVMVEYARPKSQGRARGAPEAPKAKTRRAAPRPENRARYRDHSRPLA